MSVVCKWLDGPRCQLVWMEVDLGPGDIVLDWDPAPSQKGHSTPAFQPTWPNRWMNQDATWCSHRPWPRPNCIRWGPSSLRKGHSNPLFSAHVYCGLTVVHLSYCWALVKSIMDVWKTIHGVDLCTCDGCMLWLWLLLPTKWLLSADRSGSLVCFAPPTQCLIW